MPRTLSRLFTASALAVWLLGAAIVFGAPQVAAPSTDPSRIGIAELARLIAADAVVIVDVRDEAMYRRGHLPNARLSPPERWRETALELRTSRRDIVTYCSCPAEETSLRAATRFESLGVTRVRALTGGYEEWAAAGMPVSAPTPAAQAASRESWQRIPDIFAAMGVQPGAVVADVGAGDGFFTTRLAAAVGPAGRVYAVDISPASLDRLRRRVEANGHSNVEIIQGATDDPRLPAGALDGALIINAYHEMREHQAMLAALRRALKPTGRLVIVEPVADGRRGIPREAQERDHQIAPHFVQQDALAAGFLVARVDDPFTRRGGNMPEYLLAFTPMPDAIPESAAPPHAHTGPGTGTARQPDAVVAALGLETGQTVVDIGAGAGHFTRRFARAVGPTGLALALEIDPGAVSALERDAASLGLSNYQARLVAEDDAGLAPATADVLFLSNTYHHISNRVPYFSRLRAALKPGGRLVIVDFPPGPDRREVTDHPDRDRVIAELQTAGFALLREHTFLAGQFFLEFGPADREVSNMKTR
ncbi:MAG TPA: methyltransferase domain-containing protein [Vicinamibacterales bacterium]|nr:methyltransferase domain-containing protein [Vicinamibacterales bacterium]